MKARSRTGGSVLENAAYQSNLAERVRKLEERIRRLEELVSVTGIGTEPLTFIFTDSTPSVAGGNFNQLYRCINSIATTITNFDDGTEGQSITVLFLTSSTTLTDGTNILLNGSTNYTPPAGTIMGFRYYNRQWYETERRNT